MRSRRLQWETEPRPEPPRRPYRDTALVYLGFAVVIVVVSVVTGGGLVRAVVVAALFWVAATLAGLCMGSSQSCGRALVAALADRFGPGRSVR